VLVLAPTGDRHGFLPVVKMFKRMLMGSASVSSEVRLSEFAVVIAELTVCVSSVHKAFRLCFD
jgi:hypothetical protein